PQQLRQVSLEQAQAKVYVRQTQVRLLVHPLLERLRAELRADALVEVHLLRLLAQFRSEDAATQGYGPANVLSLLKDLRGHLHRAWQAHTDTTIAFALSPDEHTLASGSMDGSVKLWEVENGALLWSGWHTQGTTCLAFSPDGRLLASGGLDATIRLWEASLGTPVEDIPHPAPVFSASWSPDGRLPAGAG